MKTQPIDCSSGGMLTHLTGKEKHRKKKENPRNDMRFRLVCCFLCLYISLFLYTHTNIHTYIYTSNSIYRTHCVLPFVDDDLIMMMMVMMMMAHS